MAVTKIFLSLYAAIFMLFQLDLYQKKEEITRFVMNADTLCYVIPRGWENSEYVGDNQGNCTQIYCDFLRAGWV